MKHKTRSFADEIQWHNFIANLPILGSGEFSIAYLTPEKTVLKVHRKTSYFHPDQKFKDFPGMAIKEMQSEIDTYLKISKILQDFSYHTCLPSFFKSQTIFSDFVIEREYGEIPLVDTEHPFLGKWQEGKVSQDKFDLFTIQLFHIAKTIGYFEDVLQPALRSDGSLFLTDLGHFTSKEYLISSYYWMELGLERFAEQVHTTLNYPEFVIKDHLDYYEQEYNEHKAISLKFANAICGSQLKRWRTLVKNPLRLS